MNDPETRIEIGRREKNSREVVVVELLEYRGRPFLDVRVHDENDSPTSRGITVRPSTAEALLPLLRTGVTKAHAQARQGLDAHPDALIDLEARSRRRP